MAFFRDGRLSMLLLSIIFLLANSLISFWDGIVIHLLNLNLHFFASTRKEHLLHSLRALLFTLILIFFYYFKASGAWAYFSLSLVLSDIGLEIWDIKTEGESRRELGGLSNGEYLLHSMAILTRTASLGIWLTQFDLADFSFTTGQLQVVQNEVIKLILVQLIFSTGLVTLVHFYLLKRPTYLNYRQWFIRRPNIRS